MSKTDNANTTMSDGAKELKRQYQREYRRRNKEKIKQYQNRYWERKFEKVCLAQGVTDNVTDNVTDKISVICACCQGELTHKRSGAKFCSDVCRATYNRIKKSL